MKGKKVLNVNVQSKNYHYIHLNEFVLKIFGGIYIFPCMKTFRSLTADCALLVKIMLSSAEI